MDATMNASPRGLARWGLLAALVVGALACSNTPGDSTNTGGATIQGVCTRQLAVSCPNNPTMDQCVTQATALQTACGSAHAADFQAFLECGNTATFACDSSMRSTS